MNPEPPDHTEAAGIDLEDMPTPRRDLRFTAPQAGQRRSPMGTLLGPAPTANPSVPDAAAEVEARVAATVGQPAGRVEVVDGVIRRRVTLQVAKIPAAQRTTIRRLLPDQAALEHRRYLDVLGADRADDDPEFPAGTLEALDGATVFYSLMASDAEIAELDAHDNCTVRIAPLVEVL